MSVILDAQHNGSHVNARWHIPTVKDLDRYSVYLVRPSKADPEQYTIYKSEDSRVFEARDCGEYEISIRKKVIPSKRSTNVCYLLSKCFSFLVTSFFIEWECVMKIFHCLRIR